MRRSRDITASAALLSLCLTAVNGRTQPARGELIDSGPATNAAVAPLPEARSASTNITRINLADATRNSRPRVHGAGPFVVTGFDTLSAYAINVSDAVMFGSSPPPAGTRGIAEQIPDSVKALDGKAVSITGFMLPVRIRDRKTTDFLLLKNQLACCFGKKPALNECVPVCMTGDGVEITKDRLLTVTGTLHVGEIRENSVLIGIYLMDGDKVELLDQKQK